MNFEYKDYELSNAITDIAAGPFGSNLKVSCFTTTGFPIIDGANLKEITVTDNITKFVPEDKARSLHRSIAKRRDVVVTISGNVGQVSYIPDNSQYAEYLCSQRQFRVTFDESKIYVPYLVYYLHSVEGQSKILAFANQTGVPALSQPLKNFRKIKIDLPSLAEQKKIAAILSALDEKIAINREINDNLQQQARTLYKSWFVDFEPFDKRMPDLWKIGKLKDVLCLRKEVLKAGKRTDLCYLPIDAIPMNTFALTATRPNEEAQSSLLAFYCDDIIIGAMRVYFHRVIIAPFDGITRSTCFVLTPKDPNYLAFGLLCCDQDKSIDFAQQSSKGSTMPYAVWDGGLGELEIAIPPQDIAFEFNRMIMPMIREIQKSYYETEILNNIRDTLLPKLMSGEIDVSAVKL